MTAPDRLTRQLAFLAEIDKLKAVERQSRISSGARRENSAEHSWHLAMFAIVLADHADLEVDVLAVVRMLLIHDIVEIDAGDHPYHEPGVDWSAVAAKERAAAERLFGLLPTEEGAAFLALWTEFEAGETAEAKFAKALDRMQPILLNALTGGGTWNDFAVSEADVLARCGKTIAAASPALWRATEALIRAHFAGRGADRPAAT